jgi:hypothetical protein
MRMSDPTKREEFALRLAESALRNTAAISMTSYQHE